MIRNTLEQTIQLEEYARSQIDVYVQVGRVFAWPYTCVQRACV